MGEHLRWRVKENCNWLCLFVPAVLLQYLPILQFKGRKRLDSARSSIWQGRMSQIRGPEIEMSRAKKVFEDIDVQRRKSGFANPPPRMLPPPGQMLPRFNPASAVDV